MRSALLLMIFALASAQVAPDFKPYSVDNREIQLNTTIISENELKVPLDFKNQASVNITPEYLIWRFSIRFNTEKTGSIKISNWDVPPGAQLFILNDKDSYTGPYLNQTGNEFISGRFKTAKLTFEYIEPLLSGESTSFTITGILDNFPIALIPDVSNSQYIKWNSTRDRPKILVTGYWPPTNEMLRHFSQDPELNPDGWQGENWEGLGFDVLSYFPEFDPPDCNNCGQGYGDLEVDYQDFSQDFWPIIEPVDPVGVITFSRGYNDQSWEIENRLVNRTNWYADYTEPLFPTPNPPDETVESWYVRYTSLPVQEIIDAIISAHIGLDPYLDDTNAGMFLSEFAGYHGVWYKESQEDTTDTPCFAAGHIHVGGQINWETATTAAEVSIRTLIEYVAQFIYVLGDITEDGDINILDIILLVNTILGDAELNGSQFLAADMDENGILNILDIISLLNLILD